MKIHKSIILLFLLQPLFTSTKILAANNNKPRIIITADPELDDNNSLIRFLLYSADFNIEGLVYASSQFHWKGDGKGTKFMVPGREYTKYGLNLCPCTSYRWKEGERFIHEAVEAYEKVYQNLVVHNAEYPSPSYLKSKIKYGNIEFEGDFTKDTEGSNLIKKILLDSIDGPVYITAWGGQSTIARALKSIEDEFKNTKDWALIKQKVSNKTVLLPSGDQDNTYASYIKPNWPAIDYRQYKNGPNYGYGAQLSANAVNASVLTADWMQKNISSKGALGDIYRVWGDGKQSVKDDRFDYFGLDGYTNEQLKQMGYIVWMPKQQKGSWLGEGDTGTFMNLLNNGLNAIEKENPGGWGGRPFNPNPSTYVDPFSNDTTKVKELVITASTYNKMSTLDMNEAAYPDFFYAAQNDFATRMDWTVKNNFKLANHAPIIQIKNNSELLVKPGETIKLEATIKEPDGDAYSIHWWQFFKNKNDTKLTILDNSSLHTSIEIPKNATAQQNLYLVLEVADKNVINVTSYKMIKIKVN
ncbi:MAG: DUF1593 domain-containing protein [Chitinophagia bacterium]|jgi:hypothetical protein|nr:DUF1593 domain-containing protein [Chitinophagia bacterium]